MKTLPAALATHLTGDATTVCQAWRVTRRDGAVLGFTEHDRDLTVDGTLFMAASGFQASDAEQAADLSADNGEVAGGFSSDAITDEDIVAGRYDGAKVEVLLVNWADPTGFTLLRVQEIGEVTRAKGYFRAELRSLASRLNQPKGRVYARRCDAEFGDSRCGMNAAAWTATGVVTAIKDRIEISATGLGNLASGFFRFGLLQFTSGALAGQKANIENHTLAGGIATLGLWLPLAVSPAPGDGFLIVAGCDKRFETCRNRFGNALNFQGFPHMPGSDFAYAYADGETVHDGRALY
jgi:uncharacterized phage protein (TIGR02218 family)